MHLPTAMTNALAMANTAWTSAVSLSSESISRLTSEIMVGLEFKELFEMCTPTTANNGVNLTFPCNQFDVLKMQCYYGRTFDEVWNSTTGVLDMGKDWTPQGPVNQRLCACESQLFDTWAGCGACYEAHGAGVGRLDKKAISSMSSSYCAASSTPTVGLLDEIADYYNSPAVASSIISAVSAAATSHYTDPLAGSTAVSYYYTPAVTGTAVFNIANVTQGATPTETNMKHGQITADSGAGAIGGDLGGLKAAFAAILALMASVVLL